MWIISLADDSHEMSSLIFLENQNSESVNAAFLLKD